MIAANIRRVAEKRKLSLNALADLAGISRAGLHFIISAKKSPTSDSLAKIADVLDVAPSKLLVPPPG